MTRLRIGLDARMDKPYGTGLGRYARGLVAALTARDLPGVRWVVLKHPSMAGVPFPAPGSDAEEVVLPRDLDRAGNLAWAARDLNRLGLDLYHALHHFLPLGLRVPRVVMTLHDLIWVEHAHLTFDVRFARLRSAAVRFFGTAAQAYALDRADAVVSVSEASRQAALRRFPALRPERIVTVHHGIDHQRFAPGRPPAAGNDLFLCLGNSKPYKNWRNAILAFRQVADELPGASLLLAGRGDSRRNLEAWFGSLGLAGRVGFELLPSDARVVELFHRARALVFPSLIEGFGLPPLEAMASGCPVIASSVPVVREVVGEAALLVDPRDPADIARALRRVATEPELAADLRRRGLAHARGFTWERAAEQTLAVYRRLLGAGLRPAGPPPS